MPTYISLYDNKIYASTRRKVEVRCIILCHKDLLLQSATNYATFYFAKIEFIIY